MTKFVTTLLLTAAAAGASAGAGSGAGSVGVIVDTTRGPDVAMLRAARAEVARTGAALRVTRSPSESVAAAATLVARGATTIVTYGVAGDAVSGPLGRSRPDVRVVPRRVVD